jgi:hypothetical protein
LLSRFGKTLANCPFVGDQVVCLGHDQVVWSGTGRGPRPPDAGIGDKDKGIPKGRTVGFRLFIADKSYIWEVDDEQIAEWAALLNRIAAAGDKVSRSILQIDQFGNSTKTANAAR